MSGLYGTPIIAPAAINTIQIENGDGSTILGVVTGEETILTATDNDVREGSVYASDGGVSTGTALIPNYHTTTGKKIVPVGGSFEITLSTYDAFDYTELQCIICPYNSSMDNSVSAEQVVIGDNVYNSNSTTPIATVVKESNTKTLNFNFINNGNVPYIIRFFTYKEIIMNIERRYQYCYAEIDPATNMCVAVYTCTYQSTDPNWVEIPEYNDDYCFKYYNWDNGKFYYDAEYTQEFISE